MTGMGFNLKGDFGTMVAAARGTGDVVELGWCLEFGFEEKLMWGDVGEVHPSLYRGIRGVRKD
jgi:hypothetical protein